MRDEREQRRQPIAPEAEQRRGRLAAALRENLQKRKAQVRARAATDIPQQPQDADDPGQH